MQQYYALIEKLVAKYDETQALSDNRTDIKTVKIFGYQTRFDLKESFPLVTLKFTPLRLIIGELLWMLTGSTQNQTLRALSDIPPERDTIWEEWAVKHKNIYEFYRNQAIADGHVFVPNHTHRVVTDTSLVMSEKEYADAGQPAGWTRQENPRYNPPTVYYIQPEFYERALDAMVDDGVAPHYWRNYLGSLGPIYQHAWRKWPDGKGGHIDQIEELIRGLKNKPFSRRHIVSAWNVADLPDESMSPEENVMHGKMSLAPCHAFFQFYVEERPNAEGVMTKYLSCQLYQRKLYCAMVA